MANDAFTAEEFETWLTPLEAMKLVVEAVGAEAATHILIERLRGGMIKSGARNATPDVSGHSSRPPVGIFLIPRRFWQSLPSNRSQQIFWLSGDIKFELGNDSGRHKASVTFQCFDIRFDPEGVRAAIPKVLQKSQPAPTISLAVTPQPEPTGRTANKGGRPPKGFWEDLWIEMFRRIHFGDFKPKNQAELEAAMHQWLEDYGQQASERTVRDAARKLFAVLMSE